MKIEKNLLKIGFLSIIFLFFFQLATLLIEAIYSVNLLGSSLNFYAAGVVWLLCSAFLFLVPLELKLFRQKGENSSFFSRIGQILYGNSYQESEVYTRPAQIGASMVILFRLLSPWMKSRPMIIIAGLGTAAFLLFYPLYLLQIPKNLHRNEGYFQGISFTIALLLSILFRTLGASRDISLYGWTQSIGWILALIGLFGIIKMKSFTFNVIEKNHTDPEAETSKKNRYAFFGGFSLMNLFILIIFGFESPTVLARWTEGHYTVINIYLMFILGSGILLLLIKPGIITKIPSWGFWLWNILFSMMLIVTILAHTITFPPLPGATPVVVGPPLWYQQLPLYIMIFLSPIIIVDLMFITSHLIAIQPRLPQLATGFTVNGLYFIILIFMAIFTNVWGYVKPISNLFRNLYWLPYMFIGFFMFLAWIPIRLKKHDFSQVNLQKWSSNSLTILIASLLLGTIIATPLMVPHPNATGTEPIDNIKVMTYNIQQGNNDTGNKNYEQQLEIIRDSGADIIALQECDTARIGLGNNDIIRYFATQLDYYSYFGPKTITGTYGTAILSRYPIVDAETIFTYSNKDETGTAYAAIQVDNQLFHVFSSHPDGNDDNHRDHMNAIIDKIQTESLSYVISMGDFNTRPNTEFYNISTAVLNDTWYLEYPTGIDDEGNDMNRKIDHIFISDEFSVEDAWVIPEGPSQSDHNVFWTQLSW